jgi:hypothetical protein
MKIFKNGIVLILLVLVSINESVAQEITKYDYLEVIVIQKMNNSGKIKRIKVEDQSSLKGKVITVKEMKSIKGTSSLLNYMNSHNWEFVDRKAITEINNPIWMSYIFRKKK